MKRTRKPINWHRLNEVCRATWHKDAVCLPIATESVRESVKRSSITPVYVMGPTFDCPVCHVTGYPAPPAMFGVCTFCIRRSFVTPQRDRSGN